MNPAEIICATAAAPAIETTVADLWREVLGYAGPIQPCDNFFALGGDSLAMMLFLFRAQEIFGVELPPAAMLEGPELLSVCGSLTAALAAASPQVPSGPAARSPTG